MTLNDPAANARTHHVAGAQRRKRRPVSCQECRRSKLKCNRLQPCSACTRRGRQLSCDYGISPDAAVSSDMHRRPISATPRSNENAEPSLVASNERYLQHSPLRSRLSTTGTSQTPLSFQWEAVLERPTPENDTQNLCSSLSTIPAMSLDDIIQRLPPKPCRDYLISHFFNNIFALFPILHGATFQKQYSAFTERPLDADLSWLALLFSLCSLALSSMEETDPRLSCFWSDMPSQSDVLPATISVSRDLLRTAMACLLRDDFFVRQTFNTFEALLMVIYNVSHNESVHQGWSLLGMALNMGIALRCNVEQNLNPIETERRRRCWAGLLTLHTYQGILFRDVDLSYLLNIKANLPADVNDADITDQGISYVHVRNETTQMSVMMCKIRLFRLSTEICRHLSSSSRLDSRILHTFDQAIAEEQAQWDSTYMVNGSPSILDSTSYAYWCVLQTYAHHLYLLLHRDFHHSKAPQFLQTSRDTCIRSSRALISIHKQLYDTPLLRNYLWLLNGITSLKALHAAVALNSCIQDNLPTDDVAYEMSSYRDEIKSLTLRMENLSDRSIICSKAYQLLSHLQYSSSCL